MSNYTINSELRIAFGNPIMYEEDYLYDYYATQDEVYEYAHIIDRWCFPESPAIDLNRNIST